MGLGLGVLGFGTGLDKSLHISEAFLLFAFCVSAPAVPLLGTIWVLELGWTGMVGVGPVYFRTKGLGTT